MTSTGIIETLKNVGNDDLNQSTTNTTNNWAFYWKKYNLANHLMNKNIGVYLQICRYENTAIIFHVFLVNFKCYHLVMSMPDWARCEYANLKIWLYEGNTVYGFHISSTITCHSNLIYLPRPIVCRLLAVGLMHTIYKHKLVDLWNNHTNGSCHEELDIQ